MLSPILRHYLDIKRYERIQLNAVEPETIRNLLNKIF